MDVERGASGEVAVLRMEKWDHAGLYLESRRGSGDWEKLGITTLPTFTDDRPLLDPAQPEVREYRARFVDNNLPSSGWCDVAKVTVSP